MIRLLMMGGGLEGAVRCCAVHCSAVTWMKWKNRFDEDCSGCGCIGVGGA